MGRAPVKDKPMGLFDIFDSSPGKRAANQAYQSTTAGIGDARKDIKAATAKGAGYLSDSLVPFEEIYGQEQQGRKAYMDSLGLGGAEGNTRAREMFRAGPGYDWQLGQGLEAINRRRSAGGMLNSGNADIDALTYGEGLANQEYGGWQDRLGGFNPQAPASGRANQLTNLAKLYSDQGSQLGNLSVAGGQAGADLAQNRFAANQGANSNIWNAIFGAGQLAVKAYAASDRKVKAEIKAVGRLDNGLPVYLFRYKSGGPFQIGLMAQDVEKVNPAAVQELDGVKYVSYWDAVA